MSGNPFTLSFGKEPKEYIKRIKEFDEIIEEFNSDNPSSSVFILTGLRGSGKTVLLTSLYKYFDSNNDFIAVDLNTRSNMLEDLAASIYDKGPVKYKFLKTDFNFSFQGISLSIKGEKPVTSISNLLENMIGCLNKHHKKLIITVDDIDEGDQMKTFVKEFQSLYRKDLPIFLIVTGLYDVVDNLEKQQGLTFLQRSQKRYLTPLNIRMIAKSYSSIFNIDFEEAIKLADLTKGYAFAYQTLGYLLYQSESKEITSSLLNDYDYYLEEYVYRRVYEELTNKEKRILKLISVRSINSNAELIKTGFITNQEISNYKEKLSKRGIIDKQVRGKFEIILPRFKEFIVSQYHLEGNIL